jgi:hypothetical protein
MNPQPPSLARTATADSANRSFTPGPGLPARPSPKLSKKAARIARVRERLSGPPSPADGSVPTRELIMENRLRARVLTGSNEGAARRTGETARTIARTWGEFDDALLTYPRDTPPEERRALPPSPDHSETSTDD